MGALVRAHWFGESENNSKPECSHGFPARCHTHLPRAFPFLLTFLPASDNAISFDATSSLCMAISMYSIHIVPSLWQLYSVSLDIWHVHRCFFTRPLSIYCSSLIASPSSLPVSCGSLASNWFACSYFRADTLSLLLVSMYIRWFGTCLINSEPSPLRFIFRFASCHRL